MNFEDFESKARLYVLGALDDEELHEFEDLRAKLGHRAEEIIADCHRLSAAFALTLKPTPPGPQSKEKLLKMVHSHLKSTQKAEEKA